ncbi:WhiB family transcriptional regulator [Streptomyces sp. NBC_01764]|uniref:WhiB family transcriptional regulator n=1 Tax=Streptomyces sp. NBC_01764 TaxID=2975935 RepID=UPI00224FE785|nr:WhiB family transcriptional regulator [Streptomyces sp. NBC_01764]MCX4411522.1 WhiB family transcriptional regulator [Streptomyces sp. NBC_01764]
MSRTVKAPALIEADPRILFPHTDDPLACRTNPGWFAHEYGQNSKDDLARIERAKTACSGCPIAAGCLKWALANRELTPTGIWAATTARQRTGLRQRLQLRYGLDWVGVLAQADRERARRSEARPPATDPAQPASAMWSSRYKPWTEPVTTDQQQRNRELLDLAQRTIRTPCPTETLAEAS